MKTDFYLAHPMAMRHKVRDELQVPLQELGYTVKNPFYDEGLQPRQDVDLIDAGRIQLYDIDPIRSREIVKSDLDSIDNAEAIIVYLPKPGIGTSMELFYAGHVVKKYAYVAAAKDYLRHPWIQTYGNTKRETLQDIIAAIWEEDT